MRRVRVIARALHYTADSITDLASLGSGVLFVLLRWCDGNLSIVAFLGESESIVFSARSFWSY